MMKIAQLLKPVTINLERNATLADVAHEIESNRMAAVFVEDGMPIGILTRRDYIRLLLNGVKPEEPIFRFARKDIIKIRQDRSAEHALAILVDHNIRRLVVVDEDGKYVGTISHDDIVDMMAWVQRVAQLKAFHVVKNGVFLTFEPEVTLYECAKEMLDTHQNVAVVLQDKKPIGIVTESDIIDRNGGNKHLTAPLRVIMHTQPVTVYEDEGIDSIMQTMHDKGVHSIVVISENGEFVGVITSQGIANSMEGNYNLFLEYKVKVLKDTLDQAPYIILEMEMDENSEYFIYWANQIALDSFGQNILGTKGSEVFADNWSNYMEMFTQKNKLEKQIIGLNKSVFELSIRRIYDGKIQFTLNDISGIQRLKEDVHQAKNDTLMAEEAIRHANAVLYKTLNSIDALIYVIDTETYEILFINGYAQSIFGSVYGHVCYKALQSGQDAPCDFCPMSIDPSKKEIGSNYYWENKNTINGRWYRFSDRHIKWVDGKKVKIQIGFDITDTKDAQEDLEALNNQLSKQVDMEQEKNTVKDNYLLQQSRLATMGSMLSAITHQWRQPLNALMITVQDLSEAYKYGELDSKYMDRSVEVIVEQIKYMSSTIDDFREFYRPHKEKEHFDMCALTQKAIGFVKSKANKIGVNILQDEIEESCSVVGYPNELMQAVINILNNSIENFEIKGTIEPIIAISAKKIEQLLEVTIEDNGGGIEEEYLKSLFEPFVTTKEGKKGTGLGLYLVKTIIEKMDGNITAENGENGARFIISLPAEG
jgi:signal transduction histidine kinase/CBS domain-containing protein